MSLGEYLSKDIFCNILEFLFCVFLYILIFLHFISTKQMWKKLYFWCIFLNLGGRTNPLNLDRLFYSSTDIIIIANNESEKQESP